VTVSEILAAAAPLVGQNVAIPDAEGIKWVNAWQDDIGLDGGVEGSGDVVATADTWVSLPAGAVMVLEIRVGTTAYEGTYEIRNGKIRFPVAGTYTIYFAKMPARVTAVTDTPEVAARWHPSAPYFVAYRYRLWKRAEDPNAGELWAQYQAAKREAMATMELPSVHGTRQIEKVSWGEDEASSYPW
jgi:hypothetical protein